MTEVPDEGELSRRFLAQREALRESEERYRLLFEAIDEGFCIIEFFDGPHGELSDYVHVAANPAYTAHAGIPDVVGQSVREMVPDEAEGWIEIYRRVLVTGEPVRFERELVATGRHLELSAYRVEPSSRRQVAVLFQDVTARKLAEDALRESVKHQKLLLAELQHRVRNTLGMVRSIARRSIGDNTTAEDYAAHFVGRLDALGRTQVQLTRGVEARIDLESLVREELLVQGGDERNFVVQGPEVLLPAKAAEVLTLALHELATNSVKYGVLGSSKGRLSVKWTLENREVGEWLDMKWVEEGTHDIPPRAQSGFGSELIERRVPYELRGKASLSFESKGLRAEMAFPLIDAASILESGPTRNNGQ